MKLIYRGTTYNYDPDRVKACRSFPRTDRSAYKLIYRGSTYQFEPTISQLVNIKPTSYELIFRGTTYQVHRNQAGEVISIIHSTNLFKRKSLTTHPKMPTLANRHSESRSRQL
jgi:Domain of unknown function (DUF4278)